MTKRNGNPRNRASIDKLETIMTNGKSLYASWGSLLKSPIASPIVKETANVSKSFMFLFPSRFATCLTPKRKDANATNTATSKYFTLLCFLNLKLEEKQDVKKRGGMKVENGDFLHGWIR